MAAEQITDNAERTLAISGSGTKQETIDLALEEFIEKQKREDIIAMAGTIDFDEDWDPRKIRGKTW
ncbi:hypothetical protein FACS1894200_14030 [Spirochaetia bacterium]|nr:hypothetical protein FACS1894200_14030 [Spirochaetia bacterium]